MMNIYEINENTIALIPLSKNTTKVIEKTDSFILNESTKNIIEYSCEYFGSSYNGRHSGTKRLTGITHKSPIIIEESREIIFFPTTSPRIDECCWLSLKHINKYEKQQNKCVITFNTGYNLDINISYGSLDNQILRATRLESVLRLRKENM